MLEGLQKREKNERELRFSAWWNSRNKNCYVDDYEKRGYLVRKRERCCKNGGNQVLNWDAGSGESWTGNWISPGGRKKTKKNVREWKYRVNSVMQFQSIFILLRCWFVCLSCYYLNWSFFIKENCQFLVKMEWVWVTILGVRRWWREYIQKKYVAFPFEFKSIFLFHRWKAQHKIRKKYGDKRKLFKRNTKEIDKRSVLFYDEYKNNR